MSRAAARPGVFGPYVPERLLAPARIRDVAYCPPCRKRDVVSELDFDTNGHGAAIETCRTCGHTQPVAPSETRRVINRRGRA
jgi:Zn ribbon nucleic-acid-binding protein